MKPLVICEVGINANGSIDDAKKLIDMSPRESQWGDTQRDQKEGLEFSEKDYDEIDEYCKSSGIEWFASAWDIDSFQFLKKYDLKYNKIASAMLTNFDFCALVAGAGKHTFISTGLSTMRDIESIVKLFKRSGTPFTLLHCVGLYPCPDALTNVNMVDELKEKFNCAVGYSGHEKGILPSVLAVAMGGYGSRGN